MTARLCHCELTGYVHVVAREGAGCELCVWGDLEEMTEASVSEAFKWYRSEIERLNSRDWFWHLFRYSLWPDAFGGKK